VKRNLSVNWIVTKAIELYLQRLEEDPQGPSFSGYTIEDTAGFNIEVPPGGDTR
jgi:hypothetical protein